MKKLRSIFFALITIVISLIFIDLFLHAAGYISADVNRVMSFVPAKISDEKLGHRPNPDYPDHDANGFRNALVPDQVDIVALGDSQTYGSGVNSEQAWPHSLETISPWSVYNMGLGGYGPVHSLLLWDEAKALKPKIIIEALYAGNDLYDAFTLVYSKDKAPLFKSTDQHLLESIKVAEMGESLQDRVSKMYRRGKVKSSTRIAMKKWLENNSKIYGLLLRAQYEIKLARQTNKPPKTEDEKWAKAQKFAKKYAKYAQAFSNDSLRTVFTSEYRLTALNLEDPRIQEGRRIVFESIAKMQQLAQQDGIRFIVLFIPTKELVFYPHAEQLESDSYRELIHYEQRFWRETRDFLHANSIETVDSLSALRNELNSGNQSYKVSRDGHPNAIGQAAIAAEVKRYLELP